MRRSIPVAVLVGIAFSLSAAVIAMAHEGGGEETIAVEPSSVTAGDTCILAGSGLEPDSERVIVLAGQDLVVEFGTVRTDAEGMFQKELTIPGHLPTGSYELRAIGDETLIVQLEVTAAAGGQGASSAANDANETIVPRERTQFELALILALVGLAAIAGGLLIWRAERFRGAARA